MESKEFGNVSEMLAYFKISKPTLYKRLSANGFKTNKRKFSIDELELINENKVSVSLQSSIDELEKLKEKIDELTIKNDELNSKVNNLQEQNKADSAEFKKLLDQSQQLQMDLQQQLKSKDQLLLDTSKPKGFWARIFNK